MKPFILPFFIALLAGTGVAGGAAVMAAKSAPVPAVADSTKHVATDTSALRVIDSAGTVVSHGAPTDSLVKHEAPATGKIDPPAPAHAVNGVPAVPTPAATHGATVPSVTTGATTGPSPSAAPKGAMLATSSADGPPPERRIARVIAAMAPRDAAKVLTQMADHDIAIIIGNLSEKQEAAILAQLPGDRLASVSKLLMKPGQAIK